MLMLPYEIIKKHPRMGMIDVQCVSLMSESRLNVPQSN